MSKQLAPLHTQKGRWRRHPLNHMIIIAVDDQYTFPLFLIRVGELTKDILHDRVSHLLALFPPAWRRILALLHLVCFFHSFLFTMHPLVVLLADWGL